MSQPRVRRDEGSHTKLEPYASLPLQNHRNSIRLPDFSPGGERDRRRGTLRTLSLETRPDFSALSYTWGVSTESNDICINKLYSITVTDNLFRALKHLRWKIKKRTLWIDAICINQCDVEERGRQVSIMGSIYRSASSVLVWLGEYSDASALDPLYMRRPHVRSRFEPTPQGRRIARALDNAIRNSNPNWSVRAWVVQEFVMAQKVYLCSALSICNMVKINGPPCLCSRIRPRDCHT